MDKKRFLAKDVLLEDYSFDFRSAAFIAKLLESRFYQDPRNPNLKKVVSTVQFSHPVDTQAFETRVSLEAAVDAQYLGLKPDSSHFTVAYDKFKLQASIHSAALEMPRDDTKMTVRVGKGIRAARGGNTTKEELSATVTVPGRTSLKFSGAFMTVVDNARYEPEQILMLTSSSPVAVVDLLPGGVESVLELQPVADSSSPGADPASAQRTGFGALPIGVAAKSNWVPEHVDVRDDRLVLYGTVGRDAGTFSYRVRATNPGVFQAPPAFAEGMYDRKVSGVGTAGRLEITKP